MPRKPTDIFGCNVSVTERLNALRRFDLEQCQQALQPGAVSALQASVKTALEQRIRQLKKEQNHVC